ncbi:AAA family ATPase [Flavobacterium restrictum]|uniref:AAA family ATPase n=1 Tax=Flavobacterium restrictum TaxID=2594428 RepID=A0A553E3S4_9FLAO|nr:AAA family ATPase [Flavobacterium restrictum]TRX39674.1 AAA family ATPase [Flavobacterium restrictum]
MRLKLQNIGIIEEADINVDGITLIAGQNDSGKSTVGKVLYALVRGVNIDEESFNASKYDFIVERIRDLRILLTRIKPLDKEEEEIQKSILNDILESENSIFDKYRIRFRSNNVSIDQNELILELDRINRLINSFSDEITKNRLSNITEEIINRISISFDSIEVKHFEIETYFKDGFGNQIQNQFNSNDSFVSAEGFSNQKITFNEKTSFEGFDSISDFYYQDVVFIESPMKLQERFFGSFGSNLMRDKNIYLNSKIFQEEKEVDIFSDNTEKFKRFQENIFEILKGKFDFNKRGELIYKKNDVAFDFRNVATGIKSFGILQLLIQKGVLNQNTLLILDEPEVHLHPTWQVKFAEILVLLSKEFAIPIILTSHSPYFIEALEAYTKKYKYESSTNFYFAKKNEDGLSSKIIDVTEDIMPILNSISEAFYTIQDLNDED